MVTKLIRTRAGLRFVARIGNLYTVNANRIDAQRAVCKLHARAAA